MLTIFGLMIEKEFETATLPNGMRIIHKKTVASMAGHCGILINAGSRDERPHAQGVAHLIEHMLFKGTERRKPFHILSRLDSVGGEINAYTSKEETCVYASFPAQHYERAIDLIADVVFNSTFPEKEIEKEKEVIADEIRSYQDNPAEQIFDDFEEMIFRDHPISRNILGTFESLKNIKRKDVLEFTEEHYHPENMVFSSVGNIEMKELVNMCSRLISTRKTGVTNGRRERFRKYKPSHREEKKETNLVHYMTGNVAYSGKHRNRTTLILLNNILGGPGMNSRLNLNIREKHGFAYTIDSMYASYSDTGVFAVYAATDKENHLRCMALIQKELRNLREKKLGSMQLHLAKQQLFGQVVLAQENRSNLMIGLGKSLMVYQKADTMDEIRLKIDRITANQLIEVANEIFDEPSLSSLTFS